MGTKGLTRYIALPRRVGFALAVLVVLLAAATGIVLVAGADSGGPGTQAGTVVDTENVTVDLRPADTPNGDRYASLDAADELQIDFESLNRESRTNADRVFTVDVESDEYLEAIVTSDSDDVSFYWGSTPSNGAVGGRLLAPDGEVSVGVAVRSTDTVAGGNFTVSLSEAEPPPDDPEENASEPRRPREDAQPAFELSETDVEFPGVRAGDAAPLEFSIRNPGSRPATETVDLEVDGERVATRAVTLQPGERRTVDFEYSFPAPGTYEIALNGRVAGSITVEPPRLRVSNASLSPTVVERGEPTTVVAEVVNDGEYEDRFVAELEVGGAVVDREPVSVDPGQTKRVAFERSFDRRGGYEISVSGEPAGTVQVESALGATVRRHGSEHGPVIGVLAIPLLAGAAALTRSNVVLFWR